MALATPVPYDAIAEQYDRLFTDPASLQENADVFARIGDLTGLDVLDVGCGTGLALDYGAPLATYTGVDPSQAMLDRLLARHPTARVACCPLATFDAHGARYDRVLAVFGVGSYLSPGELARIPALLRPGGRAIVMFCASGYVPVTHVVTGLALPYVAWAPGLFPGTVDQVGSHVIVTFDRPQDAVALLDVADLLPPRWQRDIWAFAQHCARPFTRVGPVPSAPTSDGLRYEVADHDVVAAGLPWLAAFPQTPDLLARIGAAMQYPLIPSTRPRCGVNVNVLDGVGGTYEMHRDTMPGATAILFATTHDAADGGALLYGDLDPARCQVITPVAGWIAVANFSAIWHAVAPLRRRVCRVSVPMEFTEPGARSRGDAADYL